MTNYAELREPYRRGRRGGIDLLEHPRLKVRGETEKGRQISQRR